MAGGAGRGWAVLAGRWALGCSSAAACGVQPAICDADALIGCAPEPCQPPSCHLLLRPAGSQTKCAWFAQTVIAACTAFHQACIQERAPPARLHLRWGRRPASLPRQLAAPSAHPCTGAADASAPRGAPHFSPHRHPTGGGGGERPAPSSSSSSPMARSRGVGAVLGWTITHALLLAAAVLAASFVPAARQAAPQLGAVHAAAVDAWALLAPGGVWHPAAFIEHKGHLVVEASLLVVISFLLLQGTFRPSKDEEGPLTEQVRCCTCCCRAAAATAAHAAAAAACCYQSWCCCWACCHFAAPLFCGMNAVAKLPLMPALMHTLHPCRIHALLFLVHSLQEIDELCEEWEPEPLYPPVSAAQAAWKEPVISSQTGTQVGQCAGGWHAAGVAPRALAVVAGTSQQMHATCSCMLCRQPGGQGVKLSLLPNHVMRLQQGVKAMAFVECDAPLLTRRWW